MSRQYVYTPPAGECEFCDEPASVHRRNLALIMVDPDGAIRGLVCSDCVVNGRFLTFAAAAILCVNLDDTPTDMNVHGGGDANS
jgi:hypothetical protein